MVRRVALVRTDVSEEPSASFIRVTRIGELGTLAATSNRRTLMKEALGSSETLVLTRATRRNIPEDTILRDIVFKIWMLADFIGNRLTDDNEVSLTHRPPFTPQTDHMLLIYLAG
jgi:hypothetical protein